jgi:uncharacterized protein YdeI (YjbR/CyaY-like superfamily)
MTSAQSYSFSTYVEQGGKGYLSLVYIQIPHEIALGLSHSFPCRVICTMKGFSFHAGVVKRGLDGFVIQMGKKTVKSSKLEIGQAVEVKLELDTTEYGYELPEEMQELLFQDDVGRDNWKALNPGHKRSFLYYICSTKNPELRLKRSILILQRAAEIRAERLKKENSKKRD